MKIYPIEKNCVIIDTHNGSIHVSEEDGKTTIYYNDHARIEISGRHKQHPLILIDSDEWPAFLHIKESEGKWANVKFDPLGMELTSIDQRTPEKKERRRIPCPDGKEGCLVLHYAPED